MRFSFALTTVAAIVSFALAAPAEPEESLTFREDGELSHAAFLKESNSTDADMLGPFEVRTLEDGTVIKETKREVLELVRRQPSSHPCGSGCDGVSSCCPSGAMSPPVATDTRYRCLSDCHLVPSWRSGQLVHVCRRRQNDLLGQRH